MREIFMHIAWAAPYQWIYSYHDCFLLVTSQLNVTFSERLCCSSSLKELPRSFSITKPHYCVSDSFVVIVLLFAECLHTLRCKLHEDRPMNLWRQNLVCHFNGFVYESHEHNMEWNHLKHIACFHLCKIQTDKMTLWCRKLDFFMEKREGSD